MEREILEMAVESFTASVTDWVRKSESLMKAVAQTAIQTTVEDVIDGTPVATGFLRASFTVTRNKALPVRVGDKPVEGQTYQVQPYALTINGMKAGDTVYGNFVADYAIPVEFGARGREGVRMVGLAIQKWGQNVKDAVAEAKRRVR